MEVKVKVYFSDFFEVPPKLIDDYGAFNISLVTDIPLFIDPFLLFNSEKPAYKSLHDQIIKYLRFLRDNSLDKDLRKGLLESWFYFREVSQTWLGYSSVGNEGKGLAKSFARMLHDNLNTIFRNFGAEAITKDSHLEKLCLIQEGVGRDLISDFTTNLIKNFLLEYTEKFAIQNIDPKYREKRQVPRVQFNYATRTWMSREFDLPIGPKDYVLLTPKDILTREETWINRSDFQNPKKFYEIIESISNEQLRAQINDYFLRVLSPTDGKPNKRDVELAIKNVISTHPEVIDHYISNKEKTGDRARALSEQQVELVESLFVDHVREIVGTLVTATNFYAVLGDTYQESHDRVRYFKDVIENKGGYKLLYEGSKPIKQEKDLQILYRLVWHGTPSDIGREVNDGRGPVDFKVSRGSNDKTVIEFKLASNSKLKRNLEKQTPIYQKASDARKAIKVIFYFTEAELIKVRNVLRELKLENDPDVVLIDVRYDNKPWASMA
jgi:hypothetical protein